MIRLFYALFFLILTSINANSHTSHYKKLKYLKYDIYLNEELIGYHYFEFKNKNQLLEIIGDGSFKVSKFGLDIINYKTNSLSLYKGDQLIKFTSNTLQNDKKKYVNVNFIDGKFQINGSSFTGETDSDAIISSLWNHEIITRNKQISSISGSINKYKVKFLGKKSINIDNKIFKTINFHLFSDNDLKMNEKKININIWYEDKSLIWIKASYQKLGLWEYRLKEIKY